MWEHARKLMSSKISIFQDFLADGEIFSTFLEIESREFFRFEICAYPSKLTFGGRCVYSTFAWTQTNGITIYSKHISLGKDKQYLGTATVVSDGVLGVTYPAYRDY